MTDANNFGNLELEKPSLINTQKFPKQTKNKAKPN